MLRGNHGSGKSTAVRKLVRGFDCTPVFGALGFRFPEAYDCRGMDRPLKRPLHILGPYETNATCGFDYITKLGVVAAVAFLERYRPKGDILFESIMTSVRIMEPSIGQWIKANKKDIVIATLTTTLEECARSIEERKARSVAGTKWNSTHLVAQQRMFERVTEQYTEAGYRMEYVSRDEAPSAILGWFREKSK